MGGREHAFGLTDIALERRFGRGSLWFHRYLREQPVILFVWEFRAQLPWRYPAFLNARLASRLGVMHGSWMMTPALESWRCHRACWDGPHGAQAPGTPGTGASVVTTKAPTDSQGPLCGPHPGCLLQGLRLPFLQGPEKLS